MLTYATLTNKGGRAVNEDSIKVCERDDRHCFVLCDGLGGNGSGDVASQSAVNTFAECFDNSFSDADTFLDEAFVLSNNRIVELHDSNVFSSQACTTAVVLVFFDNRFVCANIGDSRIYMFEDNVVTRTIDHSVPQMLALQGSIDEDEIRFHPDRNKVLKALGAQEEKPNFTVSASYDLKPGQSFLLCSDGFWELISEKKMNSLLKNSCTPEEWVAKMQQVVLKNGADKNMDNYSAIAVFSR